MPIPSKAYCPESLTELVNRGWDTNRERDASDAHDRSTPDDKLRTALLAFACGDDDAYAEALAMIVEVELELRDCSTRSPAVIREAVQNIALSVHSKRAANGDKDGRFYAQLGAMVALGWTQGKLPTGDTQRLLGCSMGE